MHKPTILTVDDDLSSRRLVRHELESADYQVVAAETRGEAIMLLDDRQPELVLLDLTRPGPDSLSLIRQIRARTLVPLIVVSEVRDEDVKVQALGLGADDYVTKPYGSRELLARVEALLRRMKWGGPPPGDASISFGRVEVVPHARRVLRNGIPVSLTATEYALLMQLVSHPGRSLTHQMLLQAVWGGEYRDEAEYLRVYISRLRHKLEEDPAHPRHILTDVRVGYRFERRS